VAAAGSVAMPECVAAAMMYNQRGSNILAGKPPVAPGAAKGKTASFKLIYLANEV